VTPEQYLEALARDGEALAVAAESRLDVPVPACPGWTMGDLVWHTGYVHRHKIEIVRRGAEGRPPFEGPADPPDNVLLGWYREGVALLVEILSEDPDRPAWSWTDDHTVGFWQRRMAQETAVHRWDAEDAAGRPSPVESELAADGVDELLGAFMEQTEGHYAGPAGTVHLHRTDGPGEWVVHLRGERPVVRRGHERCDAAMRGGASELLLALWRRRPPETVELLGDRAVLDGFLAFTDLT
jgi:uncharacterized protein (TIGR03083 family)